MACSSRSGPAKRPSPRPRARRDHHRRTTTSRSMPAAGRSRSTSSIPATAISRSAATRISSRSTARCEFDRAAAWGMKLDGRPASGVRFEPGVTQVGAAGADRRRSRRARAGRPGQRSARRADCARVDALKLARARGYHGEPDRWPRSPAAPTPKSTARPRATSSGWATPSLLAEIEHDFTRLRRRTDDRRRQESCATARASRRPAPPSHGILDIVVQNATIIDAVLGIVKADIGIRDGRIVGIGKAGNPDIMHGVDPDMSSGPNTTVDRRRLLHRHRRRRSRPRPFPVARSSPTMRWPAASRR